MVERWIVVTDSRSQEDLHQRLAGAGRFCKCVFWKLISACFPSSAFRSGMFLERLCVFARKQNGNFVNYLLVLISEWSAFNRVDWTRSTRLKPSNQGEWKFHQIKLNLRYYGVKWIYQRDLSKGGRMKISSLGNLNLNRVTNMMTISSDLDKDSTWFASDSIVNEPVSIWWPSYLNTKKTRRLPDDFKIIEFYKREHPPGLPADYYLTGISPTQLPLIGDNLSEKTSITWNLDCNSSSLQPSYRRSPSSIRCRYSIESIL